MKILEDILAIADKNKRQQALMETARQLKVNWQKARRPDGELSEDEVTVLIYDALQKAKTSKIQGISLVMAGLFITAAVIAATYLFTIMTAGNIPGGQ